MSKGSSKRGRETGKRPLRARAELRAQRFATWKELHGAVLAWCWAEVERAIGAPVDRIDGSRFIGERFREVDDEPRRLWRSVRDVLGKAIDYVDANPEAGSSNVYAHFLDELVSFRCLHEVNAAVVPGVSATTENRHRGSVRSLVQVDRVFDDTGAEDWSRRTRIVRSACFLGRGNWWWGDRDPTPRDIAILSLLAGNVPEGMKQRQEQAHGADRPTVADVVGAEVSAVRAAQSTLRRARRQKR